MSDLIPRLELHTMTIIQEIAAERHRQINKEGWTAKHDDDHQYGEMAHAAACYARFSTKASQTIAGRKDYDAAKRRQRRQGAVPGKWPWDPRWWKPKSPRRDLIRAAALIVAEIERLDREAAPAGVRGGK